MKNLPWLMRCRSVAAQLRVRRPSLRCSPRRVWLRRTGGSVVCFIGFMLSPLSWWNDLVVNVPLALAFAWLVSCLYAPAFPAAFVVAYAGSNVLGFGLMHVGARMLLADGSAGSRHAFVRSLPLSKRRLATEAGVALLYTAVVMVMMRLGFMKPLEAHSDPTGSTPPASLAAAFPIHHPDPVRQRALADHARVLVRRSLELIRDQSTLNVRILTRSPLAREDFDLFRSLGDRLVFGMSLPTLRNDLSRVYEPKAPAPTQRLATLRAARNAGLPVFVALAPTYPECDEADLRATLRAVAELDPITVFHEPINIRAENVARIAAHARALGVPVNTGVFATRECWQGYALNALQTVERLAAETGLADRLHLWPDKSLGSQAAVQHLSTTTRLSTDQIRQWLHRCWNRISEWPSTASSASRSEAPVCAA